MSKKEIAIQVGISTLRGAIGAIPFVGTAINEFAFEARGRIKQERVNQFIYSFAEHISQFKESEISIEQIKNEDFGDFFEELLIKVSRTHSEAKRDALKNLLTNQIIKPKGIDYTQLLLEIISSLHENQIPILQRLKEVNSSTYIETKGELIEKNKEFKSLIDRIKAEYWKLDSKDDALSDPEIEKLEELKTKTKKRIDELEIKVKDSQAPFIGKTYDIPSYEFFFLIQDLCAKGLLIDYGMKFGAEPYELIEISQLGIDLIDALT